MTWTLNESVFCHHHNNHNALVIHSLDFGCNRSVLFCKVNQHQPTIRPVSQPHTLKTRKKLHHKICSSAQISTNAMKNEKSKQCLFSWFSVILKQTTTRNCSVFCILFLWVFYYFLLCDVCNTHSLILSLHIFITNVGNNGLIPNRSQRTQQITYRKRGKKGKKRNEKGTRQTMQLNKSRGWLMKSNTF